MRAIILMFSFVCFSLVSCKYGMGKRVKGNGHTITTTKTPGNFTKVEQKGSFDIILKSGSQQEVLIEAEENLIPHIETFLEGDKLVIRPEEGFRLKPTRAIRIVITAPKYESIWSYGSGNILGESMIADSSNLEVGTRGSGDITLQVQVPQIKAVSQGSGNINLSGETREVLLESAGSGDLKAEELKSENATIEIRGSGNATANASKALNVEVRGSGDVAYKGNPAIKTDIKGSGNLRKID
jgi:hypothetical protein